jgi:hypothetical protein
VVFEKCKLTKIHFITHGLPGKDYTIRNVKVLAYNRVGQTYWTQELHMIIFRNSGAACTRDFDGAGVLVHGFNTVNYFTFTIYTDP